MTPEQQLFVEEYFNNGFVGYKAYMDVYGAKKDSAMRASSALLRKNQAVKDYLKQLKEEARGMTPIVKERVIMDLTEAIQESKRKKNYAVMIQAINTLNRMCGFDEATKTELTHNFNKSIKDMIEFDE